MDIKHKIGAIALTAAIALGGTTAVLAGGNGNGSGSGDGRGDGGARITNICAHKDEIVARLTERQTNLTTRIAKLQAAAKKATDTGHPHVAERLDVRIARLQKALARVTDRIAKAPAFIAAHCS